MTISEFSNGFDILFNNIMSNKAPGLDEYEKSVLLTKAQLELLKNYFNPAGNKYGQGIDNSPKRQMDFSNLITIYSPSEYTGNDVIRFDDRSKLFKMPDNILFMLDESGNLEVNGINRTIMVIPLGYAEYTRLMSKPWKGPLKNQGWRLFRTDNEVNVISEIITGKGSFTGYRIRYVRKPKPIILVDLKEDYDGVKIDGLDSISECELDSSIHHEILQRAVELAKSTYIGDFRSITELGQRSE